MATRLIRASVGDTEYVAVTLTETTATNISGATFKVSLGAYDAPNGWRDPDAIELLSSSQVRLKLLVGAQGTVTPAPGIYWLWAQISDNPETEAIRIDSRIVIT